MPNFKSIAIWVAILTGFKASLVLFTFPNPTFVALMPVDTLASVIAPSFILLVVTALLDRVGASAVPVKSPANFIFPFVVASASTNEAALDQSDLRSS